MEWDSYPQYPIYPIGIRDLRLTGGGDQQINKSRQTAEENLVFRLSESQVLSNLQNQATFAFKNANTITTSTIILKMNSSHDASCQNCRQGGIELKVLPCNCSFHTVSRSWTRITSVGSKIRPRQKNTPLIILSLSTHRSIRNAFRWTIWLRIRSRAPANFVVHLVIQLIWREYTFSQLI